MPDLESIAPESCKHHVEDQGISKCDSPGGSLPMSRRVVPGIVAALLALAGLLAYAGHRLSDRCGVDPIIEQLTAMLPKDQDGDGFVVSNIQLAPDQFFAWPYRCEADVTPIRGNVDLSQKQWQHVQYEVSGGEARSHVRLLP
jgi:hypothetical protein